MQPGFTKCYHVAGLVLGTGVVGQMRHALFEFTGLLTNIRSISMAMRPMREWRGGGKVVVVGSLGKRIHSAEERCELIPKAQQDRGKSIPGRENN